VSGFVIALNEALGSIVVFLRSTSSKSVNAFSFFRIG